MTQMTGGRALVEMLRRHNVDTLFGLPGVQNDHLYNALYDVQGTQSEIRVIHTRHEQGAAYMAYGYAKATGRAGVYAVVPGPGMLNTTAALSTGYATNAPMLCISGQIPTGNIGRGYGFLHEIPDSLGILRGLTKWAERADHPAQVPELVNEAFKQMLTGRPRPVALEVPMDVLGMKADITLLDAPTCYPVQMPDLLAIESAAMLLGQAKNPLIMIGSGAENAGEALLTLAEMIQAPVVATTSGKGVISSRHPLSLTGPGGHKLWAKADVVLAIGTRLQSPLQNWGTDSSFKLIRIDVDPVELRRIVSPTVGILSDANAALQALNKAVPAHNIARASRYEEMNALKEELAEAFTEISPQFDYVREIRAALPDDAVYFEDLTQVAYASRYMMPSYMPRTHISSGYQGTLGFGFASAMGAKVAFPNRPVMVANGDGGFMYTVQELATAVQHKINLVAVVFNDGAFGNVQRMQKKDYGGKVIGSDLQNPDFVALARAHGAASDRVHDPVALGNALREAFKRPLPTIIEVPVGEMSAPWKYIMMSRLRG